MKQTHAAEILGVSQPTLSRWECYGLPHPDMLEEVLAKLAGKQNDANRALGRLVEESSLRVHLVSDVTHVLLAASRPRLAEWRESASDLLGRSLWRYASPEIQRAECMLPEYWDDQLSASVTFWTGENRDSAVPIPPAFTLWERIRLEDGRDGRLVTTVPGPAEHARWLEVVDYPWKLPQTILESGTPDQARQWARAKAS